MFCKKCGKEVDDDSVICCHCGEVLNEKEFYKNSEVQGIDDESSSKPISQSKSAIGVLFALFLGIIGLIIGIAIYPPDSVERDTFIRAWVVTFVISVILGAILLVFLLTDAQPQVRY